MIAASTYLPSASSSTIAASSIHGTGAQNFSSAMRNGCSAVSGIAFGPNFSSRRRASSLVRPVGKSSFAAAVDPTSRGVVSGSGALVTMIYRTLANLVGAHQKWRSFWVGSAALVAGSFVASAVGALGKPLCTGCLRSRHAFFPLVG